MTEQNSSITDDLIAEIENSEEIIGKMPRQEELEEKMRTMGVERYWSNVHKAQDRGQETNSKPVKRMLNYAVIQVLEGIKEFITKAEAGKSGRKHNAYHKLKLIEPETAALITARCVLDGITKGEMVVPLSRRVASMIEDELNFREYKKQCPTEFQLTLKRVKKTSGSSYLRQRGAMKANAEGREVEWDEWSAREQVVVGGKLLEIMMEKTGMVEYQTRFVGPKQQAVFVEATPTAMEWLEEEHNRCEALTPGYLPTIIPPRPWTSPTEGGYWTRRVRRLHLIKSNNWAYMHELANHDMPKVYDAINAMQRTPWRVNQGVLDVQRAIWGIGGMIGGVPSAEPHELPPKPEHVEARVPREIWDEQQTHDFKAWKREATDVYALNARLKSLRLQFMKILSVAEMFESEDEIFFPHQMDFRGRAYAVPMFLTPQGADPAKGLLEFANAVPIENQEASDWLAIHGANCFGYDKAPLQDRVLWVEMHWDDIKNSVEYPLDHTWWANADKPFQFLAFCQEWVAFKEHGWGYESHLPVQMDGSCNGLQNYSAMLRDSIGGEATNLTPSVHPVDIYQKVADLVQKRVEGDVAGDDEWIATLAQGWLTHGITRKVTKRPVMTLAYGAKQFGFKQQVWEDTVNPYKLSVPPSEFCWPNGGWEAADYMGRLIWECVAEVVVAAREAMDWMQSVASTAAKEGLPVQWTTPDDLVVLQSYPKMDTARVILTLGGSRVDVTVAGERKKELNKNKQANGIAPNWIHSMDSSHLRATVRRCWNEGMRSFALIHDSYGTHAGNAASLAEWLRDEFVEMYQDDVMTGFRDEVIQQLPEGVEIPDLPAMGDLDLDLVRDSQFFFA